MLRLSNNFFLQEEVQSREIESSLKLLQISCLEQLNNSRKTLKICQRMLINMAYSTESTELNSIINGTLGKLNTYLN